MVAGSSPALPTDVYKRQEYGGGLYVTEMVTARALVERKPESMRIIEHDPDEKIRSIQIYGVDAVNVGKAVRMVVEEDRADHIDLNFGCPAPKVTRRGGGAALPWKTDLFTAIVQTAVKEASRNDIPLTIKTVSYTHLDVYKRQSLHLLEECCAKSGNIFRFFGCFAKPPRDTAEVVSCCTGR